MSENKMGVMSVKKLIITMALPMMLSMLVQALYNIVDSFFVAKISENAVTAVTLVFPMQNLMIALGSGTGVGINAVLSKALGAKNFKEANRSANTGIFLIALTYVAFALLGFFAAAPFIHSQTEYADIAESAITYMRIVSVMSFGCFFQMTFERLLQSTGRTLMSMISQMTGAIINIILDPILIFGLCGMPKLGVAGAAWATVIGQIIAAILALILNITTNKDIKLSLKDVLKPDKEITGKIYFVGIPSILMMSIGSIMTYLMNRILGNFTSTAQAVFGIYFKVQSFFFMPIFGLNNGLIPVMAYNYGAKNKARIMEALKFSVVLALSIMSVGSAIFLIFPDKLLSIFEASDNMLEIGIPALRIIALHYPVAAVCIVLGTVFQAFAKSFYSLIISLGRQIVILIPAAYLLSLTGVVGNVWWCFPMAEVSSLTLTLFFFRKVKKGIIDKL